MLQTRAGRCPNCKDEIVPGVETCPSCGAPLAWENDAHSTPRAASSSPLLLRLFVLFLVACLATVLAVTIRSRFARQAGTPELEAGHAVLVQDAEMFREGIKAAASDGEAPEAAFVIGVALPNQSETLEVTVKNEWKTLDYPTRLSYAARLDQRWKAIHAPHRAAFSILDEAGEEIGGRSWKGAVWVVEQSENTSPSAPTPTPTSAPTPLPTPLPGALAPNAAGSASTPVANGTTSTSPQPDVTPHPQATPASGDADDLSDIETQ